MLESLSGRSGHGRRRIMGVCTPIILGTAQVCLMQGEGGLSLPRRPLSQATKGGRVVPPDVRPSTDCKGQGGLSLPGPSLPPVEPQDPFFMPPSCLFGRISWGKVTLVTFSQGIRSQIDPSGPGAAEGGGLVPPSKPVSARFREGCPSLDRPLSRRGSEDRGVVPPGRPDVPIGRVREGCPSLARAASTGL